METNRRAIDVDIARLIQRMDDFKELVLSKFDNLDMTVKNKCLDCAYAQKLLMRADSNWWHIVRLWAMIGFIWGTIFTIVGIYLKHHTIH